MMLKLELGKAFRSHGFRVALLAGLLLAGFHAVWIRDYLNEAFFNPELQKGAFRTVDVSFLQAWMGQDFYSVYGSLFYLILFPLLAALPYADACFRERALSYDKNLIVRAGKRAYCRSKLLSAFLTGGVVVTVPAAVSLIQALAWLPAIPTNLVQMQTGVYSRSLWAVVFYSRPVLYCLLYLLLDFVLAGGWAVCSMALSRWVRSRYSLLILPMMLNLLLVELLNWAPGWLGKLIYFVPYAFVQPLGGQTAGWMVCVTLAVMLAGIGGSFYWMEARRDVL